METVLEGIVDDKTLSILKTLLTHKTSLYHLNKLAEDSGVPIATTSRIVKLLVGQDIAETINVGKIKLYRTKKNKKTGILDRLIGGGVKKPKAR
jgi:CO dehydrogenase/acetyl-CoA synthase epsilon subunit